MALIPKPSDWAKKLTIYQIRISSQTRIKISYFLICIVVALPVILLFLPADFFDSEESICLSKSLFDIECYACGLTKACMHLIHLDFEGAFVYNMGSFIVLPLVCILWIKWFFSLYRNIKKLNLPN